MNKHRSGQAFYQNQAGEERTRSNGLFGSAGSDDKVGFGASFELELRLISSGLRWILGLISFPAVFAPSKAAATALSSAEACAMDELSKACAAMSGGGGEV